MPERRAFFCHASEDAAAVNDVFNVVTSELPDLQPWLDRYEIVGGDSLLGRIAEGINTTDKFFVFLSRVTIDKPWVTRELRKAIMREIKEETFFIVPVKIGTVDKMPDFLEDRLYIDLTRLSKADWLKTFDAAVRGEPATPGSIPSAPNLNVTVESAEESSTALVWFEPRTWAEEIAFAVTSTVDMLSANYLGFLSSPTPGMQMWSGKSGDFTRGFPDERKSPRQYSIRLPHHDLRPGQRVAIKVQLPAGADPRQALTGRKLDER
ncbi:MAG: toll/interleukin-1 receptor domain-containing protein [Candidatus Saccharibacteria bacterium]|nr:toll/interleukin-1 receptor domain-containing protein [Candidatus Saccharibacteria bacterium]